MDELIEERTRLGEDVARHSGAFPGSKAYRREEAALAALTAFDEAHPEVLPEINRRRFAEIEAERIPALGR